MREYLLKNPREQHVSLRIAEIYEKDLANPLAAALEYEEVLKQKLPAERWGWAAIHLEGRGQPTGYSIWDDALGDYRERPEAPTTTADPGPDPDAMTQDTRVLLDTVTRALGGRVTP